MVAGNGELEANGNDTLSVKTDNLQRANQIEYKCE